MSRVGVVVIGRNEGDRLRRCFASLRGFPLPVVYVDSGSADGSPDVARTAGAGVIELDPSLPFTAARARNVGLERLCETAPEVEFVQFLDGDCELADGWLDRAAAELGADPGLAVVCGRRRERSPEASVYNRLCDMEWDTPTGDADACGGDALMRVSALREVGGYRESLRAGEEPELCLRLRTRGYRVRRLDAEMTRHDAAMTRFAQWWGRNVRAGYAFAEVSRLHRRSRSRIWGRPYWSNWFWGLLMLPLAPAAYPAQMWRVYRSRRRRGNPVRDAWLFAFFVVLGKVPQMAGQWAYHRRHTRRPGGPRS